MEFTHVHLNSHCAHDNTGVEPQQGSNEHAPRLLTDFLLPLCGVFHMPQIEHIKNTNVELRQGSREQQQVQELCCAEDAVQECTQGAIEWLCVSAGQGAVAQQQVTAALMSPDLVVDQPGSSGRHQRHKWVWAPFVDALAYQGAQLDMRETDCTCAWPSSAARVQVACLRQGLHVCDQMGG